MGRPLLGGVVMACPISAVGAGECMFSEPELSDEFV